MDDYDDIEYHAPPREPTVKTGGNTNHYRNEEDIVNVAARHQYENRQHQDRLSPAKSPVNGRATSPGGTSQRSNVGIGGFGPYLGVTMCILFTELCERLTYYGISGNLLLFCQEQLNTESATASTIVLAFTGVSCIVPIFGGWIADSMSGKYNAIYGVSYIVPIFGGWIADSVSGKYNAIYGSALIYVIGTALLPLVALPYASYSHNNKLGLSSAAKHVFFAIALIFISVGTGGIKSNVSPFGAEQVQALGPGAVRTFFNWFYWFINVGSFVSYTLVVYVQTNQGFFWGYLIPFGGMVLAILIFVAARKKYICSPPNGSVLTDIFRIISSAVKRKSRLKKQGCVQRSSEIGWLDYARVSYGGRYTDGQVNTVISLCRILPIFATMILYWTVYFQMQSSFLLQGLNMNLKMSTNFKLPAASLSLFDVVIILVLIPFMDRIVYPLLQKCKVRLTSLRRMGIGMIFAALSVIVAAVIERYRRDHVDGKHMQTFDKKTYNASSISVFYQAPQFILIGTSEVFASISGLEFAYSQSPRVLQGVVMGLFLATSGLGSLVGSALVNIVKSLSKNYSSGDWYANDINKGRLDLFFYVLAGLLGVNFLIFCMISVRYTYVTPNILRQSEQDWQTAGRSTPRHLISDHEEDESMSTSPYSDTYDN